MLSDLIDFSSSDYKTTAALSGLLAIIGLVLTTVGVYGVIASRTARRTKEMGIRIALGATRGRVLRLVCRDAAYVTTLGTIVGVPAAFLAADSMGSMLFDLRPHDAVTLGATIGVLGLAIATATLLPAWRATRVDPTVALRDT